MSTADRIHFRVRDHASKLGGFLVYVPQDSTVLVLQAGVTAVMNCIEPEQAGISVEKQVTEDLGASGGEGAFARVYHAMRLYFTDTNNDEHSIDVIGPKESCFDLDTVTVNELDADVADLIAWLLAEACTAGEIDLTAYVSGQRLTLIEPYQKLLGASDAFSRGSWAADWRASDGFDVKVST